MSDTDAPETQPPGPQPPLEPHQALQIVAEACARYQGDLAAHQTIQRALQKLNEIVSSYTAGSNGSALAMNREQRRRGRPPKEFTQEANKE